MKERNEKIIYDYRLSKLCMENIMRKCKKNLNMWIFKNKNLEEKV